MEIAPNLVSRYEAVHSGLTSSTMVYARHGVTVRFIYLGVSLACYLLSGFGRLVAARKIVLCYHGVTGIQSDRFRKQMEVLARRFAERPNPVSGEKQLNNSSRIILTFDDAFANLLDNVFPTLEQYRIPAIVFAVSGNLGKRPNWAIAADHQDANELTMTADQLQALSKHPLIRIGSHTQTHPDLSKLLPERVRQELVDSKRDLEQILSRPVDDLALPHGAFNDTVLQIAREVGFKRIYTLEPRVMPKYSINEGVIGRFSMSPDVWPIEFLLTCTGAYAWLLSWRKFLRRIKLFQKHLRSREQ